MATKNLPCGNRAETLPPGTAPRLYVAGLIQDSSVIPGAVAVKTPEEARKSVDELIRNKPDIVKVRVDDFLGARQKMSPEVYQAAIDEAHKNGFRTAAHVVLLEDAKGLLRAGVDYIAHSVRDREVDEEFIRPHEETPCFLLSNSHSRVGRLHLLGNAGILQRSLLPERSRSRRKWRRWKTRSGRIRCATITGPLWYKEHMPIAMRNLKKISDAGIVIAMGTDSGGGPGRFQGYFEHLELEYETKAGLTPMQALVSATSGAAKAMNISKEVGTLEKGKLADFVVLSANPLDDIKNTRAIESVWIGGVRVPGKKQVGADCSSSSCLPDNV